MWYRRCPGLIPGPRGWKFKHRKRVPGHSGLRARAPEISMHILCFFVFASEPGRSGPYICFLSEIFYFSKIGTQGPETGRGGAGARRKVGTICFWPKRAGARWAAAERGEPPRKLQERPKPYQNHPKSQNRFKKKKNDQNQQKMQKNAKNAKKEPQGPQAPFPAPSPHLPAPSPHLPRTFPDRLFDFSFFHFFPCFFIFSKIICVCTCLVFSARFCFFFKYFVRFRPFFEKMFFLGGRVCFPCFVRVLAVTVGFWSFSNRWRLIQGSWLCSVSWVSGSVRTGGFCLFS